MILRIMASAPKIEPYTCELPQGQSLVIREARVDDAAALLDYVHAIAGESDFLTFGPGEFERTQDDEEAFLGQSIAAENQLFLLGLIDDVIVSSIHFAAGARPRIRHTGEFGMSVRKLYWGHGIGSAMIDALVEWARNTQLIKKINLRVRTDNDRAIALYRRKGFEHEGTIRREILIDDRHFDQHCMGLAL